MNHIGNHAPNHESVGLIYPDWGEVLVPWNEPAEGAALIHLELLWSMFEKEFLQSARLNLWYILQEAFFKYTLVY